MRPSCFRLGACVRKESHVRPNAFHVDDAKLLYVCDDDGDFVALCAVVRRFSGAVRVLTRETNAAQAVDPVPK